MTSHLTGALAAIIADPDCCAASKAIARAGLGQCQPQDTPQIDVDALADELTSAANIVTNGGYYEIDADAVAQLLMRAFAAHDATIRALADALAFYAAEPVDGYFVDATVTDSGMSMKVGPVIQDGGHKARTALAERALSEMVATAQAAGDYGTPNCQPQDTAQVLPGMRYEVYKIDEVAVSDTTTDSTTKPVISRPAEPARNAEPIWYRGWECAFDAEAASWSCEGWVGYLGGADLDCATASGRTWSELLDEIDDHDMTEKAT